jgi:hypothetical protein
LLKGEGIKMSEASKEGVRETLTAENLGHFNWFEDRYPQAEEAGIVAEGAGWRVYLTDERACSRYKKLHADEGEALADFLKRVRAIDHILTLREERHLRQADASDK